MRRASDNSYKPPPEFTIPEQTSEIPEEDDTTKKFNLKLISEQAIFTKDPIPPELCFEGMKKFILPIPYIGYQDKRYICHKLLYHFFQGQQTLKKTEKNILGVIKEAKEKLTEAYSRRLTPVKKTKSTENAYYWRLRVVLFHKQTKLIKKLQLGILEVCYKHLDTINKLYLIIDELMLRPRSVSINVDAICYLFSRIRNEACIDYAIRLKCIDEKMADVKTGLKFHPRQFVRPEKCINSITNIIEAYAKCKDPATGYYNDDPITSSFAEFIESIFSPIKYNEKRPQKMEELINKTVDGICSFAGLKQQDSVDALRRLSANYWFNKIMIADKKYAECNTKLATYAASLKNRSIGSQGIPDYLAEALNVTKETTVSDFVRNNKVLDECRDHLIAIIFQNSPYDIAFVTNSIHLKIADIACKATNEDAKSGRSVQCLSFLWKVLFITSDIPYLDELMNFVVKYTTESFIPEEILERFVLSIISIRELEFDMNEGK